MKTATTPASTTISHHTTEAAKQRSRRVTEPAQAAPAKQQPHQAAAHAHATTQRQTHHDTAQADAAPAKQHSHQAAAQGHAAATVNAATHASYGRSGLPHPKTWAVHLAQVAMELLCGRRCGPQLAGWATPAAITELTRTAPPVTDPGRVRSVRATVVGPAQVEVVVILDCGQRCRAMAIRLTGVTMPARPGHRRPAAGPRWLATSMRLL